MIEANRVYTPSSRLQQEIEDEARQRRIEKEKERERKAKLAADKATTDKLKSRLAGRTTFNTHQTSQKEERTASSERQAQFKYDLLNNCIYSGHAWRLANDRIL